jgi:ribonucleotide reductase beta subunit family protein with ferritin-like domain
MDFIGFLIAAAFLWKPVYYTYKIITVEDDKEWKAMLSDYFKRAYELVMPGDNKNG